MAINTHDTLRTDAAFDTPQAYDSTDIVLISTLDALFAECCALILESDPGFNLKRVITKEFSAEHRLGTSFGHCQQQFK